MGRLWIIYTIWRRDRLILWTERSGDILERRAWRCEHGEGWGATEENFEVALGILPLTGRSHWRSRIALAQSKRATSTWACYFTGNIAVRYFYVLRRIFKLLLKPRALDNSPLQILLHTRLKELVMKASYWTTQVSMKKFILGAIC